MADLRNIRPHAALPNAPDRGTRHAEHRSDLRAAQSATQCSDRSDLICCQPRPTRTAEAIAPRMHLILLLRRPFEILQTVIAWIAVQVVHLASFYKIRQERNRLQPMDVLRCLGAVLAKDHKPVSGLCLTRAQDATGPCAFTRHVVADTAKRTDRVARISDDLFPLFHVGYCNTPRQTHVIVPIETGLI